MGWPQLKEEEKFKEKQLVKQIAKDIREPIIEHFGREPMGKWFTSTFEIVVLIATGSDFLKKYGYCEYCKNYIGTPVHQRKMYNIFIINSYCKEWFKAINYNDRCFMWEPKKFFKSVLENFAKNKCTEYQQKNQYDWWINPFFLKTYVFDEEDEFTGY